MSDFAAKGMIFVKGDMLSLILWTDGHKKLPI